MPLPFVDLKGDLKDSVDVPVDESDEAEVDSMGHVIVTTPTLTKNAKKAK